jgi:hypothetical protein
MTNFIIGALLEPFSATTRTSRARHIRVSHDPSACLAGASKATAWVLTVIDFTLLMNVESRRAVA